MQLQGYEAEVAFPLVRRQREIDDVADDCPRLLGRVLRCCGGNDRAGRSSLVVSAAGRNEHGA